MEDSALNLAFSMEILKMNTNLKKVANFFSYLRNGHDGRSGYPYSLALFRTMILIHHIIAGLNVNYNFNIFFVTCQKTFQGDDSGQI